MEEGKTRQKAISPLHDPGRDNVKQGKTNKDKKDEKRQLRKKERREAHQSCDGCCDRHSNFRRDERGEVHKVANLCDLGKGYLSLSPCTELWLPRDAARGGSALHCALSREKGRSDSGVGRWRWR